MVSAVSISALNAGIGNSIGIGLKCGIGISLRLSSKNEFVWSFKHSNAFDVVKQALTKVPTLAYFDMKKETRIMTDTSHKDLGFVSQPKHGDKLVTVQVGTRFLNDPETCYATIENEILDVTWSIKKCHTF